jgi:hypothetical protein
MRTASWAISILILALSACSDRPTRGSSASSSAAVATIAGTSVDRGQTQLVLQAGAERLTIAVPRDDSVAPEQPPTRVTVVASTPGALVITDSYPSAPGGLSYCQAGEETFLRVIATAGDRAERRYDLKVASCRGNLELADPGIEWFPATNVLRVSWLMGPHGHGETRMVTITSDGRVEPSNSQ